MSAHFAKCSYPQKLFFRLSPESWSFVSFGSPSLSSSSLLTRLRSLGPQTYVYKSRSMLSIDGRLVLKFHSRQNLFSKIPWHLLKTRHLVRNSSDHQTFSKNLPYRSLSQLLLDGRFGPKFHLAQTFFDTCLSSFSVLCCPLQFSTVCYGTTHARWSALALCISLSSPISHADSNDDSHAPVCCE